MSERNEWRLQSGQYFGEISALCFLHLPSHFSSLPYLLIGTGSQMLLYDLEAGNMMKSFHVFEGIRVHGICCCPIELKEEPMSTSNLNFEIAVFGERRVKLFNLKIEIVPGTQNQPEIEVNLNLSYLLPKFSQWVLDVSFLKDYSISSPKGGNDCLAVGCSDNSVHVWDTSSSRVILEVRSPERCLLYSMRLWGDELNKLHIASGTIYNEIIVWKVVPQNSSPSLPNLVEDQANQECDIHNISDIHSQLYEALFICRLSGHEGSIFRISWSSNGSTIVSVSDDRCARIWKIDAEKKESDSPVEVVGPVLFGHSARVWDCCIFGALIVTAGEDCTCRVWGLNGDQLKVIKEHIGRGIWRCLYDPKTSLLITAGFDSCIKVHRLHASLTTGPVEKSEDVKEFIDTPHVFTFRLPNSSKHIELMDSKSEYVRCMHFASENTLYVATNNGYLYHAQVFGAGEVIWTELVRLSGEVPIVCMDILSGDRSTIYSNIEDWIAIGDGKGGMTVVRIVDPDCNPKVGPTITWSAGAERQLLGTHWCKALRNKYIFTTDPRGALKLWSFPTSSYTVFLVAEFISSFGIRIICLDASYEEEVLVCGDLRGNLILFPLSKSLLLGLPHASEVKITPLTYFKGAHGISTIFSISMAKLIYDQIEIHSTGADGCICYLTYDRNKKLLEFTGMKKVKELSLIESVATDANCMDDLESDMRTYAIGFSSSNFIIWNLLTETKVAHISCGGWRRPHSYYLGDLPEMKNCFAYVKDDIIYLHKQCVPESDGTKFNQNLRMQFHGREIHSICFFSEDEDFPCTTNTENDFLSKSSDMAWVATGCEDGTVRLSRYTSDVGSWSASKLLGEHVGGSAVKSIYYVSKIHNIGTDNCSEENENPSLLISVGAKRVVTVWMLRKRTDNSKKDQNNLKFLEGKPPAVSFQWLSTDMPSKYSASRKNTDKTEKVVEQVNDGFNLNTKLDSISKSFSSKKSEKEMNDVFVDDNENDWRYLAVTAFHAANLNSKLTVCFIVVSCSNATLALRALVLPYRFWFDVAILTPVLSPVLALRNIVVPIPFKDNVQLHSKSLYIIIGGSTDGSIAFWDLTQSVEAFMLWVSSLDLENSIDCQKRPRTGRGSQGGRLWKVSNSNASTKIRENGLVTSKGKNGNNEKFQNHVENENLGNSGHSSFKICEICALHVLKNVHQSGVNCLHVSETKGSNGTLVYDVVSGGDDQALHSHRFDFEPISSQRQLCEIRFLCHDRIASSHSSAVKGVWTDGKWAFSTGLDQRVRCWHIDACGKLIERAHLVISVPEPEALNARSCGENRYQIAVAGRGMQMVEFSRPVT